MKREGEFGEGEFNRYLETFEANLSATGHQEMRNDSMQYALERINNSLLNLGENALPKELGRALPQKDFEYIVQIINSLVQNRILELEQKSAINSRAHQWESEKSLLIQKLEKMERKINENERERNVMQNEFRLMEENYNEKINKICKEKEEIGKEVIMLRSRDQQYKHQIKNKETEFEGLKVKIVKLSGKDKSNYANSDAKIQQIHNKGLLEYAHDGGFEFEKLVNMEHENTFEVIKQENMDLRECLTRFQKEIFQIIQIQKNCFETEYANQFEREFVDEEQLLSPNLDWVSEKTLKKPFVESGSKMIEIFEENLNNIRICFERMREFKKNLGLDREAEKNTIGDLKNMCNNFNQVIEAQKLTISNTTIKQNQENLEPNTSYKYNTVADGAIEQMWKNLEKFREVVKTNQQEIDLEKELVESTTKKLEDDRSLVLRQKEMLREEKEKWGKVVNCEKIENIMNGINQENSHS